MVLGTSAASMYQSVETQTVVSTANGHTLVQMLLDGAVGKLNKAKAYLEKNDYPPFAENISTVIAIIDSLRASLNFDEGGEIAKHLNHFTILWKNIY